MESSPSFLEREANEEATWFSLWRRFSRGRANQSELLDREREALEATFRASLKAHVGEGTARARFTAIADRYRTLSRAGKVTFFTTLTDFDVDAHRIAELATEYANASEPHEKANVRRRLRREIDGPRMDLLSRFNAIPNGVKFLVDLRADLLAETDRSFAELDDDLRALLASWFDVGFLELRRITWDAPASLLERLARYEAVHEMRGWNDLKNRLDRDRRCYAFFHPAMPLEPLIFIELALTNALSESVAPLLDSSAPVGNPETATTAVFYSISNCQRGLEGISFGNALIKRVAHELSTELPNLKRFGTLSPLPGFRAWLEEVIAPKEDGTPGPLSTALNQRGWHRDAAISAALREPLLRLCANYLLDERRSGGRARDPVAHFHLSNGASIERINWAADPSKRALHDSAGMMVNYLYRLDRIEANQDAYAAGRIEASTAVQSLNDGDYRPSLADALGSLVRR